MKQLFIENLDFIFLFYGAAFFFLGTACLVLNFRERHKKTLPWLFLSLFGFIHGLNEWLDMLAISFINQHFWEFWRLVALTVSFLCLLEFARRSINILTRFKFNIWLYAPLIFFFFVASNYFHLDCLNCANSFIRYFLGFPAALGTACVFFILPKKPIGRLLPVLYPSMGSLFLIYAFSTGLIVPRSHFFLAPVLNNSSFMEWAHMPIQFFRGFLATLIAFLFVYHVTRIAMSIIGIGRSGRHVKFILISFALLYFSFLCVGFSLLSGVDAYERQHLNRMILSDARLLQESVGTVDLDAFSGSRDDTVYKKFRFMHSRMSQLAEISSFARSLYLVYFTKGRPVFLVGSQPQIYPLSVEPAFGKRIPQKTIADAYYAKRPTIVGPYVDFKGGRSISVFIPLFGSEGKVSGILGMDLDAYKVQALVYRVRLYVLFVIMAFLVLLIVGYSFLIVFLLRSLELEVQKENLNKALSNLKEAEAELARSEETFKGILNNSPNAIFGFDRDLRIIFWNFGAERLYGFKKDEVVNEKDPTSSQRFIDLFGVLDVESAAEEVFLGVTFLSETVHKTRNGQVSVIMTLFPVKDPQGHILFGIGLIQDFSEHKLFEEQLAAAHSQLRSVLDGASLVSIIATDLKGNITVFNKGAEHLLGYSQDEMVGKQTPLVLHSSEEVSAFRAEMSDRLSASLEGFDIFTESARRGHFSAREWTYVRKDGTTFPVYLMPNGLYNDRGELTGVVVVGIDLTSRKTAERAFFKTQLSLIEERDRLNKIAASIGAGLSLVDRDFKIVWVNETMEKWFGKLDTIKGMQCYEAYQARHAICDGCPTKLTFETGEIHTAEQRLIFENGKIMDFSLICTPLKNERGEVEQVLELTLDITDKKRTIELLEYERALSKNVINSIGEELMVLDCHNKTILDVNKKFLESTNFKKEEVIGKACFDLGTHFCPPCEACDFKEVTEKGRIIEATHIHLDRNGKKIYADVTLSPLKDEKGNVIGILHLSKDVSDRKRLEDELRHYAQSLESLVKERTKALQESELMFRRLFESAQDGILIIDPDSGKIIDANPYVLNLLECTRGQIQNIHYQEVPGLRDSGVFGNTLDELKTKITVLKDDVLLKTLTGKEITVEWRASLYYVEDKKIIQCNIRDVTERKRIDKIKSEFVSMVSHELRTPLSAIKEGVEIVADGTQGKLNKSQGECLAIALSNIKRLNRLIGDILDISKIQSNLLKVNVVPCDIYNVVEQVYSLVKIEIEKRGMVFVTDLEKGLPLVMSDKDRLIQVLMNLLNNAVKFTREKSRIMLFVRRDGDFVTFGIRDEGAGIPADELTRLFGKFVQLDSTLVRRVGGTGLGLYISRNLVEAMGGQIWAESKLTEGSTFYFSLPIERQN